MKKYDVSVIDEKCRFYALNDLDGKRIATIEYCGWKWFKYEVSFAYITVEKNLDKTRNFRTLKEAKKYVEEIIGA